MFRVYFVSAVAVASFAGGCSAFRPEPLLEKEVLVEVLVELHLLRARATLVPEEPVPSVDSLLSDYGVSGAELRKTMQHYANRPDEYVALMDTVIDRMRLLRPDLADDLEEPNFSGQFGAFRQDTARAAVDDIVY